MGMIEGAMIGGAIGLVVVAVTALRTAQWQKKFVRALEAGDHAGAQRELARRAPAVPAQKSFPLTKLLPQRQRLIGLWLLGDRSQLESELAVHKGGAAYVANVEMFGLLALATMPDTDASALVARLDAAATRVDTESTKLQKLLRDLAKLLARVGGGLAGRAVDDTDARALLTRGASETLFTRILVIRALIVIAERGGRSTLQLQKRLALDTKLFGQSPSVSRS